MSVIIPTLNEEKLVERLLKQFTSELRSRYSIEVIISDGGSEDDTIRIGKRYADRIVEKELHVSQNISRGRNAGAKESRGDVLVFLNADVVLNNPECFFARALSIINEDSCIALACRVEIGQAEQSTSDYIFHKFYNNYVRLLNASGVGMGRGECHIILRSAFEASGGYDENITAGEDFDLYCRLRKVGNVRYINDLIVFESPRRYRKFGYLRVFFDWARNSVSVLLFKRSVSDKWEPVR